MTRSLKSVFTVTKRELMNDPQFDWTRRRTSRRWLVAAFVAMATVTAVSYGLAVGLANAWYFSGVLIGILANTLVVGSINASVRGLTELKTRQLDEWQIARRDAMFRILWLPAIGLMGAAAYIGAITHLPDGFKGGFALWSFLIALYVPTAALAWTYPDDPEP